MNSNTVAKYGIKIVRTSLSCRLPTASHLEDNFAQKIPMSIKRERETETEREREREL